MSQAIENTVCNRHHAISLLFANDPELLDFFFTRDRKALRFITPKMTLRYARKQLKHPKILPIHIALDLWLNTRRTSMAAILRDLTRPQFEGFVMGFELLYDRGGCNCQNCKQRELIGASWPS